MMVMNKQLYFLVGFFQVLFLTLGFTLLGWKSTVYFITGLLIILLTIYSIYLTLKNFKK